MKGVTELMAIHRTYKNWIYVSLALLLNRGKSKMINVSFRNGPKVKIDRLKSIDFALLKNSKLSKIVPYEIREYKDGASVFLSSQNITVSIPPRLALDMLDLMRLKLFSLNYNSIKSLSYGILDFEYRGREVKLRVLKDGLLNGDLGLFINDDYSYLEPANMIVIDIGANICDSSFYFALNDAQKVIALEPYPYTFEIGKENVRLNGYESKITLINAGYGADNTIRVKETYADTGTDLLEAKNGIDLRTYSLKTLLDMFNLQENLVLKMDCEGCEYYLLEEEPETLQKFRRIEIEYHHGHAALVKKLLMAGFNVKFTRPKKVYNPSNSDPKLTVGMIHAHIK